ncbi:MAG: hypothetical protein HXX18_02810 [Bacteroidetes bacterium]|nr:hypothetical protein [Bacteroidota bacterium]
MKKVLKNRKNYCIGILFLFITTSSFSQYSSVSDRDFIYNAVCKNILIYRILEYIPEGINKGNYIDFHSSLPDNGDMLILDSINKLDLKYPKENYILYSIIKGGWRYTNYYCEEVVKWVSTRANYYCDTVRSFYVSDDLDTRGNRNSNSSYLIAYNPITKDIKYISGSFFLHQISQDFNLSIDNPDSFIDYIKYKLYFLHIKSIELHERTKRKIVFKLTYFKKDICFVELNKKDFEFLKITTEDGYGIRYNIKDYNIKYRNK